MATSDAVSERSRWVTRAWVSVVWRDGVQAGRGLEVEPCRPTRLPAPRTAAANRGQAFFNAVSLVVAVISAVTGAAAGVLALFVSA